MRTEKWYEKYSWWIFVVIALTGLIPAIQLLISPHEWKNFFRSIRSPSPRIDPGRRQRDRISILCDALDRYGAGRWKYPDHFYRIHRLAKRRKMGLVSDVVLAADICNPLLHIRRRFLEKLADILGSSHPDGLIMNYRRFFSGKYSAGVEQ